MTIEEILTTGNSVSAARLRQGFESLRDDDALFGVLLPYCKDPSSETSATWLVLEELKSGRTISADETSYLIGCLGSFGSWEAQLHVLQSIQFLRIPDAERSRLWRRLLELIESRRTFVRAWAYDALSVLADQHHQFRAEVTELVTAAKRKEAPSVVARIRNIRRMAKWP